MTAPRSVPPRTPRACRFCYGNPVGLHRRAAVATAYWLHAIARRLHRLAGEVCLSCDGRGVERR